MYRVPTGSMRGRLCTARAVVRAIDNDLPMDSSAIGQTVHLAARMDSWPRRAVSC
jgi:class 3 adenylate cyclase